MSISRHLRKITLLIMAWGLSACTVMSPISQSGELKLREEAVFVQSSQIAETVDSAERLRREKEDSWVSRYMEGLTIEERVGQIFLARMPEKNNVWDLQRYYMGGYVLFQRDYQEQTTETLKALLRSYQASVTVPLLIASDEEGGTVTRISSILDKPFKSPQTLYQEGGLKSVINDAKAKGKFLRELGIHTGLFPVADVATDREAFIYDRTLGTDLGTTAQYVEEVVKVLRSERFGSVLKHFPGYGNNADSHVAVVHDKRSLNDFRNHDLLPFAAGIKAGADAVLLTHNVVEAIDNVPASISPNVTKLLREELGFEGVIMTDDFDMAGLSEYTGQTEGAYRAIMAGVDMVMSSHYNEQIPYILEKVYKGEIEKSRIDESVKRILRWKYRLGVIES